MTLVNLNKVPVAQREERDPPKVEAVGATPAGDGIIVTMDVRRDQNFEFGIVSNRFYIDQGSLFGDTLIQETKFLDFHGDAHILRQSAKDWA